ncbi:MAG: Uma2 family endonuclease [Spirochaetaceae bacterium]|nr:MAG: Uma2 family endonuclease [Spirochaetaceae bacterium]
MGVPKTKSERYTYADYYSWDDDERWELIDGVAYNMSPAPVRRHQQVLLRLVRLVSDITDRGSCETYVAPFDVRFSADEETDTVVQPDISVFCDPSSLDDRGAIASPILVIEILSPSTSHKDMTVKLELYERHSVREYWVVNADAPWVMVYRLGDDARFRKPDYYRTGEAVVSEVLSGERIALGDFL